MFYTLVSRIPLISNLKNDGKFLKIFIIGSLMYILLHYYLFSDERWYMLEKLKSYLYYIMAFDLGVAYFVSKWYAPTEDEEEEKQNGGYTYEERLQMERDLQELKRMQSRPTDGQKSEGDDMDRVENKNNVDDVSQKSPFMTKDEVENKSNKSNKSAKSNKSKKSTEQSKTSQKTSSTKPKPKPKKKKSKEKSRTESDTQIDVYMGE